MCSFARRVDVAQGAYYRRVASWKLGPENGTLTLHTDVGGRAARLGHRLTIVMDSWHIDVEGPDEHPTSVSLIVDVDSLRVVSGEGGLTPLSAPEKIVVRSNALKTLDAKRFPTIEFHANQISTTGSGYRLHGPLTVHGVSRVVDVDLTTAEDGDGWRLNVEAEVSQAAHKVKPYSLAMGSMKVADVIKVSFEGHRDR